MKIGRLLLAIIVCSCTTTEKTECNYSTDYYPLVYKADNAFETAHYKKAFDLYEKAFIQCEPKNTIGYNELSAFTECSAILQKFAVTYEYAKKQVLQGVELNRFQYSDHFNAFFSSEYGTKFLSEYETLRNEFVDKADFDLRDELIAMRYADQLYRGANGETDWAKQDSIDMLQEKRLIEIFESIGYPTDKMVGPPTMDYPVDLNLLLLHTKDSIRMHYFVPKVKEFVKKGTASPRTLGTMIDQYYLYNDQPQIYGTYRGKGGGYATMIDDLKKVDSNRISIGLAPLHLKEQKDSLLEIKWSRY